MLFLHHCRLTSLFMYHISFFCYSEEKGDFSWFWPSFLFLVVTFSLTMFILLWYFLLIIQWTMYCFSLRKDYFRLKKRKKVKLANAIYFLTPTMICLGFCSMRPIMGTWKCSSGDFTEKLIFGRCEIIMWGHCLDQCEFCFFLLDLSYNWQNISWCLTGLVFSEYLLSGQVAPIDEVNDEEPIFPVVPVLNAKPAHKVSWFLLSWMQFIILFWKMISVTEYW